MLIFSNFTCILDKTLDVFDMLPDFKSILFFLGINGQHGWRQDPSPEVPTDERG